MAQDTPSTRIVVPHSGDHTVLNVENFTPTPPGPHQLLVQVAAAGVNFIDTYIRSGIYPATHPYTPGSEGAGTVIAVGAEVQGFDIGDTVSWNSAPSSYATHVLVPAANAIKVPKTIDPVTAAAIPLQGLTAHYLATSSFPLSPGDIALVHAGAGGVGLLLTQIASLLGAKVITTVSTQEKEALSYGAGASEVINYSGFANMTAELPGAVRAAAARLRAVSPHSFDDGRGDGVDVVYDGVGKSTFQASLASLRTRGSLVLFGGASGQVPPFNLQELNAHGSLTITRPSLGHFLLTRRELESRMNDLFVWIEQGKLNVRVGATYPLTEASAAQQALETRQTTGKVLLLP